VDDDLDVRAFWEENERCMAPFSTDKPRVPLTFWLDDHFILQEMALPSTVRYFEDLAYRLEVNRACNERLEAVLGRRFYPEETIHRFKGDFEIAMGARREITEGNTPWIVPCDIDDIGDVKRWIEWATRLDMRRAAIPADWYEAKARFEAATGKTLLLDGFGNTGPATLACNILGTTNVCTFIMDEPEVMRDFFTTLCDRFIAYHEVVCTENLGHVPRDGFGINDDNCFLFPPRKYEELCAPFLERVFCSFAPDPAHRRR
jgi:uroporphyrinogen decarboxylase